MASQPFVRSEAGVWLTGLLSSRHTPGPETQGVIEFGNEKRTVFKPGSSGQKFHVDVGSETTVLEECSVDKSRE